MKKAVNGLVEKIGKEKKEIWKELIKMREEYYSKAIKSSFDQSVRIDELTKFFVNEFEKSDLNFKDMYKNYTKPIHVYLG